VDWVLEHPEECRCEPCCWRTQVYLDTYVLRVLAARLVAEPDRCPDCGEVISPGEVHTCALDCDPPDENARMPLWFPVVNR
jgi:hypothetical protein